MIIVIMKKSYNNENDNDNDNNNDDNDNNNNDNETNDNIHNSIWLVVNNDVLVPSGVIRQ